MQNPKSSENSVCNRGNGRRQLHDTAVKKHHTKVFIMNHYSKRNSKIFVGGF